MGWSSEFLAKEVRYIICLLLVYGKCINASSKFTAVLSENTKLCQTWGLKFCFRRRTHSFYYRPCLDSRTRGIKKSFVITFPNVVFASFLEVWQPNLVRGDNVKAKHRQPLEWPRSLHGDTSVVASVHYFTPTSLRFQEFCCAGDISLRNWKTRYIALPFVQHNLASNIEAEWPKITIEIYCAFSPPCRAIMLPSICTRL